MTQMVLLSVDLEIFLSQTVEITVFEWYLGPMVLFPQLLVAAFWDMVEMVASLQKRSYFIPLT
jgi:hypothetical protein